MRTLSDIEFIISDTGNGMDQQTISNIYNSAKFYLPGNTTQQNIQLIGMGLATVQLILEKMGSKLSI